MRQSCLVLVCLAERHEERLKGTVQLVSHRLQLVVKHAVGSVGVPTGIWVIYDLSAKAPHSPRPQFQHAFTITMSSAGALLTIVRELWIEGLPGIRYVVVE